MGKSEMLFLLGAALVLFLILSPKETIDTQKTCLIYYSCDSADSFKSEKETNEFCNMLGRYDIKSKFEMNEYRDQGQVKEYWLVSYWTDGIQVIEVKSSEVKAIEAHLKKLGCHVMVEAQ